MMPAASEEGVLELLRRFREGDESAASQLLGRYLPRVREMVRARLRPGDHVRRAMQSEDILQEALLEVYANLPSLEVQREGEFVAFMARVVANTVVDAARHGKRLKRDVRREQSPDSVREVLAAIPASSPTPSEVSMGQEALERMLQALHELGETEPRFQGIIILRRFGELSYEDIAAEMDLGGAAQARTLLSRALAALARRMGASAGP